MCQLAQGMISITPTVWPHNSGIAGAPKYGDVSAWALKLEKGIDAVYANAINGIRGMPARGTCMSCSDDEVKSAIDYILANSK